MLHIIVCSYFVGESSNPTPKLELNTCIRRTRCKYRYFGLENSVIEKTEHEPDFSLRKRTEASRECRTDASLGKEEEHLVAPSMASGRLL